MMYRYKGNKSKSFDDENNYTCHAYLFDHTEKVRCDEWVFESVDEKEAIVNEVCQSSSHQGGITVVHVS